MHYAGIHVLEVWSLQRYIIPAFYIYLIKYIYPFNGRTLIRHIFVHSDGKPNQEFREKYPQFKLNQKKQINVLDLPINKIMNKVKKIIKMIDKGMLEKGFFPEDEIQY